MKTLREMMDLIESAQHRFDEPLTGWHIVYRNSGNPVHGTPSFETQDQAQKYLMTRMFANHHELKVVHTAGVGVAEAFGLYGPFTVTINTGERPQSRTKTKTFKREDDAILWAQDWLEDFSQYVFATAEVTDPEGNVVWTTDESLEEASVYKKDQDLSSIPTQELEAFVRKHWGGGVPTYGQGKSVQRAMRELRRRQKQGVPEEQVEESTPDALARIDNLFRK